MMFPAFTTCFRYRRSIERLTDALTSLHNPGHVSAEDALVIFRGSVRATMREICGTFVDRPTLEIPPPFHLD